MIRRGSLAACAIIPTPIGSAQSAHRNHASEVQGMGRPTPATVSIHFSLRSANHARPHTRLSTTAHSAPPAITPRKLAVLNVES